MAKEHTSRKWSANACNFIRIRLLILMVNGFFQAMSITPWNLGSLLGDVFVLEVEHFFLSLCLSVMFCHQTFFFELLTFSLLVSSSAHLTKPSRPMGIRGTKNHSPSPVRRMWREPCSWKAGCQSAHIYVLQRHITGCSWDYLIVCSPLSQRSPALCTTNRSCSTLEAFDFDSLSIFSPYSSFHACPAN